MQNEGYYTSNDFRLLSSVFSILGNRREYAQLLNHENLTPEYQNKIMDMIELLNKDIRELLTL